jgi:hypothetical protein
VLVVLAGKINCVLIESRLSTDTNSRIQVEGQFPIVSCVRSQGLRLEELVEPGFIGGLGVAVEEESCMIWICQTLGMQFLEVGGEVVYPLRIQELAGRNSHRQRRQPALLTCPIIPTLRIT